MSSRLVEDALWLHDPNETTGRTVRFLRTHVERIGAKHLIVRMSGGVDSSVAAVLCAMAMGGRNTLGYFLGEAETKNRSNARDAREVAHKHRITLAELDITPLVKTAASLVHSTKDPSKAPLGNIKARLRAMILYYYANTRNGIVVGTGNKKRDHAWILHKVRRRACDIEPLADLYKTTIRDLGRHLKLSARICSKPSSSNLWPGQTAEAELGLEYVKLDMVLWGLERRIPASDISTDLAIPLGTIQRIRKRWLLSEHKRRPPSAIKLGFRTSGQDLRIPYGLSEDE